MNEAIKTKRLNGKNVVVIGGSKGLGRAIVAAAHAQGAHVLAVARQEEPLKQLADDFSGVHILGLDATDESAPRSVSARAPSLILRRLGSRVGSNSRAIGIPMSKCRCSSLKPR